MQCCRYELFVVYLFHCCPHQPKFTFTLTDMIAEELHIQAKNVEVYDKDQMKNLQLVFRLCLALENLLLTLRAIFLNLFIAEKSFIRLRESRGLSGATPSTCTHGWPDLFTSKTSWQIEPWCNKFTLHDEFMFYVTLELTEKVSDRNNLHKTWCAVSLWNPEQAFSSLSLYI